jgi:hypothetical protein
MFFMIRVGAMIRQTLVVIMRLLRGHNKIPSGGQLLASLSAARGLAILKVFFGVLIIIN